jgi:nucleoside-triphosphatase
MIDEIGKMECFSEAFVRQVRKAFESDVSNLATIPLRGGGEVIDGIRRRGDVETILVRPENRDRLPEDLAGKLSWSS